MAGLVMDRAEKIALLKRSLQECSEKALEFFCQKDLDNAETYEVICTIISGFLMELEEREADFWSWKDKIEALATWRIGETELANWLVGSRIT